MAFVVVFEPSCLAEVWSKVGQYAPRLARDTGDFARKAEAPQVRLAMPNLMACLGPLIGSRRHGANN
jgi:hypothetical protein